MQSNDFSLFSPAYPKGDQSGGDICTPEAKIVPRGMSYLPDERVREWVEKEEMRVIEVNGIET